MEHLFISLFAISISSLVRCLLRSLAYFTFLLFVFLLLGFTCSLYILDNCPLSDISFAVILSQSLASLLILLILSVMEKILIVINSSLSFFSFADCLWWCFFLFFFFKSSYPKPSRFSPMLFSRSLIVLRFTFGSLTYFELIFVKSVRCGSRFICLCLGVQLLQHHSLKDCLCSIVPPLLLCERPVSCLSVGLLLQSPFCSMGVLLHQRHTVFIAVAL